MIKKIITLASGTAISQIIAFASLPIITRLYSPYDFGVFSSYSSILSVVMPIAALSFPIAIVVANNEKEVEDLSTLSLLLAIAIAFLTFVILFILQDQLFSYLEVTDYSLLLLTPIPIIGAVLLQIKRQLVFKNEEYKLISLSLLISSILTSIFKITFGFVHPTYFILIVSFSFNYFIQFIVLKLKSTKDYLNFKSQTIYKTALMYKDYAIFRTPQTFIFMANSPIRIAIIGKFFGMEAVGFYSFALLSLGAPIALISQTLTDVTYSTIAKPGVTEKEIKALFKKMYIALIPTTLIICIIIFAVSQPLYSFVFGADWIVSGSIAKYLTPWLLAGFIFRPMIAIINLYNFQKQYFLYEVLNLFIIAAVISYCGYNSYNINETVLASSLTSLIINIAYIILIFRRIKWMV